MSQQWSVKFCIRHNILKNTEIFLKSILDSAWLKDVFFISSEAAYQVTK